MMSTVGRSIVSGPPVGSYVWNGTSNTHGYYGGSYTGLLSYTYPDTSTGNVLNFSGSGWVESNSLGTFNEYYLDFWFRPTATNIAIFSETTSANIENAGYHYNTIEINTNGTVSAGIWVGYIDYVTSSATVTLSSWNHIYFYYSAGTIRLELNGSANQVNKTGVVPSRPGQDSYFGIGMYDVTRIATSNRYQGYMDTWYGGTTIQSSRYTATKAKYGY